MVSTSSTEKSFPVCHGRVNRPAIIPAEQEKINTAHEPYSLTIGIFIYHEKRRHLRVTAGVSALLQFSLISSLFSAVFNK